MGIDYVSKASSHLSHSVTVCARDSLTQHQMCKVHDDLDEPRMIVLNEMEEIIGDILRKQWVKTEATSQRVK